MLYAEIIEKDSNNFELVFYGKSSGKEQNIFWDKQKRFLDSGIKGTEDNKGFFLVHLAERGFIPGGDNIFYKKGFLDFFG